MKIETDFLIIGSGISGLSLALNLSKLFPEEKILLITKESLHHSSTYHAQGGIACVSNSGDNFEKHIKDTILAGDGLCNEKIVKTIITQAPKRIGELIELGVKFTRNENGEYDLGKEGGHSERRILHVNDQTGQSIEDTLIRNVEKLNNIEINKTCQPVQPKSCF